MVRPFHSRWSKVPGKGKRQSAGRLLSRRVVRTGAPSTVKKSRGAMIRKSASRASSLARSRARSVRSPSAKACSRQAMRRNKCSRWRHRVSSPNTSRYFWRMAPRPSRRSFSISTNTAVSKMSSSPWRSTTPHMNALWGPTGKQNPHWRSEILSGKVARIALPFRRNQRDESGAPEGSQERKIDDDDERRNQRHSGDCCGTGRDGCAGEGQLEEGGQARGRARPRARKRRPAPRGARRRLARKQPVLGAHRAREPGSWR